jgi:hypothetical protein
VESGHDSMMIQIVITDSRIFSIMNIDRYIYIILNYNIFSHLIWILHPNLNLYLNIFGKTRCFPSSQRQDWTRNGRRPKVQSIQQQPIWMVIPPSWMGSHLSYIYILIYIYIYFNIYIYICRWV